MVDDVYQEHAQTARPTRTNHESPHSASRGSGTDTAATPNASGVEVVYWRSVTRAKTLVRRDRMENTSEASAAPRMAPGRAPPHWPGVEKPSRRQSAAAGIFARRRLRICDRS